MKHLDEAERVAPHYALVQQYRSNVAYLMGDRAAAIAALKKALALEPDRRYQTAREFARDLSGHFTTGRSELSDLMETLFPELRSETR